MHFCLPVFHREDQDVINMVEKYCDDCGSYGGTLSINTKDKKNLNDLLDFLQKAYEPLFYPLEVSIEECDDCYYIFVYGKCDWFEIGGRCSGILKDKDGYEHDIIKTSEIDFDNSLLFKLQNIENYITPDGEWHDLKNEPGKTVKYTFDEAIKDDLYVTIVDCHN